MAHSYVSPEILTGVADVVGDSFELSKKAQAADCDMIIFAAVKFMAETAKILNPTKQVFVPSEINGCSLADSITAKDINFYVKNILIMHSFVTSTPVPKLKRFVMCVTSSNVYKIVKNIPKR